MEIPAIIEASTKKSSSLRRRASDKILEQIYYSIQNFLEPLSSEELYKLIVDEASKLVKAEWASIHLLNDDGELVRVYTSNPLFYSVKPRKRGQLVKAFKKNTAFVADASRVVAVHPEMAEAGIKSILHIPLPYEHKSIGILVIYSQQTEHFSHEELEVLKLYGSVATLALKKTQLFDETKKALESRDLFISMAAHELRTPITTISGYIQLLKNKFKGKGTTEAKWVEELSWESYRLTELVKELLEINKIRSGQFEYSWKEVKLRSLFNRAITIFKLTNPKRQLIVKDLVLAGKDPIIIGDFDKLIQAVNNVLENAAKYSNNDTPIFFTLKSRKYDYILEVKDKGRGISKKDLEKVFETYYRAGETQKEGMGLGLSLVKYIVANHHGEIKIFSKEGKGTRVEIILPKLKG